MGTGQCSSHLAMPHRDWQPGEALCQERAFEVGGDGPDGRQFTQPVLRRDLPNGGGTDQNGVLFIRYRGPRSDGKGCIAREPPEQGVCVSSSRSIVLFPGSKFLLRKGLKEFRADGDDSAQRPEAAPGGWGMERNQFGNWLLTARENYLLSCFDTGEKLRQSGFRAVDCNRVHGVFPS
jgi:hypothetical protein